MPFLIIVAASVVVLFLIFLVWTNHETRLRPGFQLGEHSSSQGYAPEQKSAEEARTNLATGYRGLNLLTLERFAPMKMADFLTTDIDRPLLITFPTSVYINQPFEVKVCIGSEQGKLPDLTDKEKCASPPGDRLQFPAHEDKPPVQVELQFAKEDFSTNTAKQQKLLEKDEATIFRFLVKPLKAEACILTVVFSYVPYTVDADEIAAVPEKVEKTTTDTTDGADPAKTEHKEVVTRTSSVSAPIMVKTEDMKIEVKSLFGLNTAELTIWKSIIGVVAALTLLAIALLTHQVQGVGNTLALVIGCAASAFGTPIYSGVTSLFNQKPPSNSTPSTTPATPATPAEPAMSMHR